MRIEVNIIHNVIRHSCNKIDDYDEDNRLYSSEELDYNGVQIQI